MASDTRNQKATVFRDLDGIVPWDADAGEHVYLNGGDLAFSGNAIVHVGGKYGGRADAAASPPQRRARRSR